jgi:hypothetical protein
MRLEAEILILGQVNNSAIYVGISRTLWGFIVHKIKKGAKEQTQSYFLN